MQCRADQFRCKRMTDAMLNSCKRALSTLIVSDKVQEAHNPLEVFTPQKLRGSLMPRQACITLLLSS